MKRSALSVSMIVGISTFFQIITQIVVTRIFGAKLNLDIFLAAVALPTIIVSIIYGTLSDSFIPLIKQKKPEEVTKYVLLTALGLGLFTVIVLSLIHI